MKQEHSNSRFDKKLREKFENSEFIPPSFQSLLGDVQSGLTNAPLKQKRHWKSILIYSFALSFLLPLLLLRSDYIGFSSNKALVFTPILEEKVSPQVAELSTEKIEEATAAKELLAATIAVDKTVNDNDSDKTNTNKLTSSTKTADKAFLGEVIPKRNHKKTFLASSTTHAVTKQEGSIRAESGASVTENWKDIQRASVSLLSTVSQQMPTLVFERTEEKEDIQEQILLPNPSKGEFYAGIVGSIYSPWIANQNTYGGFNGYEFAYAFSFEQKVKYRVGYNSYGRWGAELGLVFNSHQGQHYEDDILGKLQTRKVDLNYWQIPFHLKYRVQVRSGRNIPAVFNLEAGVIYNKLKYAKEIVNNGIATDITERFRPSMWQASFGISTDFYFSKRFFTTVGFKSQFSNDINGLNWQVSDGYGKSHSVLLSAELGISYRLTK